MKLSSVCGKRLVWILALINFGCSTGGVGSNSRRETEPVIRPIELQAIETHCDGKMLGGFKEGRWDCYYKNAVKSDELSFLHGKKHGVVKHFQIDGTIVYETNWREGFLDGDSIHFYPSGSKELFMQFKQGTAHGPAEEYYESGEILRRYKYENGSIVGPYREFDRRGNLIFESEIINGEEKVKFQK